VTPGTNPALTRLRLFELLRQENLSLRAVERLSVRPSAVNLEERERIQRIANKSWRPPTEPTRERELAAVPRRYDEFFRAVRTGSRRLHIRHL